MRLSCVCMQKKSSFSNKIYKPVSFFKNSHKKLFLLQNVMKTIVQNALFFRKKLSASPKNCSPPPPPPPPIKMMVYPLFIPPFLFQVDIKKIVITPNLKLRFFPEMTKGVRKPCADIFRMKLVVFKLLAISSRNFISDSRIIHRMMCESMSSTNAEIAPMHCCLGEPDCLVGLMLLFRQTGAHNMQARPLSLFQFLLFSKNVSCVCF